MTIMYSLVIILSSLYCVACRSSSMESFTSTYEYRLLLAQSEGFLTYLTANVSTSRAIFCNGNAANDVHVQVLFVFDITISTNPAKYIAKDFVHEIDAIVADVKNISSDAEFALVYHANWPGSAFYEEYPYGHSVNDNCYIRKTKFEKDISSIKSIAAATNEGIAGPASTCGDSALPAAAFAAVDNSLGWERKEVDGNGKRVHRFIVIYTDDDSIFHLDRPGERTAFRYDETDSCATSGPPTYKTYNKIFTEKGIKVIGLLTHRALEKTYRNHFNGIGTPFCSVYYYCANSFRRIKSCMEHLIRCAPY